MASVIRMIYRMIMKHLQKASSKGISTLLLLAGKTYEYAVRTVVEEQYLPTVPVPVHSMESFYNSAAEPDETADSRLCTGEIASGELTTVEKMHRCSCLGVGKDPGRNSVTWNVRSWHPGEDWSQEHQQAFSEQWETQKLWISGKAWTFSRRIPV